MGTPVAAAATAEQGPPAWFLQYLQMQQASQGTRGSSQTSGTQGTAQTGGAQTGAAAGGGTAAGPRRPSPFTDGTGKFVGRSAEYDVYDTPNGRMFVDTNTGVIRDQNGKVFAAPGADPKATVAPAEVIGAKDSFGRTNQERQNAISLLYKHFLGREATAQELAGYTGMNNAQIMRAVQTSQEAANYVNTGKAPTTAPAVDLTGKNAPAPATSGDSSGGTSAGPGATAVSGPKQVGSGPSLQLPGGGSLPVSQFPEGRIPGPLAGEIGAAGPGVTGPPGATGVTAPGGSKNLPQPQLPVPGTSEPGNVIAPDGSTPPTPPPPVVPPQGFETPTPDPGVVQPTPSAATTLVPPTSLPASTAPSYDAQIEQAGGVVPPPAFPYEPTPIAPAYDAQMEAGTIPAPAFPAEPAITAPAYDPQMEAGIIPDPAFPFDPNLIPPPPLDPVYYDPNVAMY